jgi:hypothetical protein
LATIQLLTLTASPPRQADQSHTPICFKRFMLVLFFILMAISQPFQIVI